MEISNLSVLIHCPLADPEKFMELLRYQCTFFIVFNIPIHYKNNVRIGLEGIKKQGFLILFFFQFAK